MVLKSFTIVLLLAAAPVAAQLPARAPTRTPTVADTMAVRGHQGWFGFRQDVERDTLVVVEVAPDSPAERAGLRRGDRITMLDSRPATLRLLYENPPMVGDRRRVTVRRGTETLAFTIVAAAPPPGTLMPSLRATATEANAVAREAQTLRGQMALKATRAPGMSIAADSLSGVKPVGVARLSTKPMLIVDGVVVTESVRDVGVNARIDAAVAGEIYETLKRITDSRDSTLSQINSPELYDKLDRMLREYDVVLRSARSNAVAGAEFEQLNPGLADYFGGASEGVFVLRVAGATPAFAAGLRAGDIVQSVNGQYVPTIAELREAVSEASGTITLRVIRKGTPASVVLRKE